MDTSRLNFQDWPLDLLVDYALKVHHRTIRREGPATLALVEKVVGENEVMPEVRELFAGSLEALESHLMKEENVLFPFLYELYKADEDGLKIEQMHCGTIGNPIRVMMMEHGDELARHEHIAALTNHYTAPADASADYRTLLARLKEFMEALKEHIHVENDIIFPGFLEVEQRVVTHGYRF